MEDKDPFILSIQQVADNLATQGARASSAMILIYMLSWNILVSAPDRFTKIGSINP